MLIIDVESGEYNELLHIYSELPKDDGLLGFEGSTVYCFQFTEVCTELKSI